MSRSAFLLRYGSAKHISDVLDNKFDHGYESEDIGHSIEYNPHWNSEHSKKIIKDDWYHLNSKALSHPTTTSEMLHDAIDSGDHSLMYAAASHPNSTEEHHMKIIHGDPRYAIEMLHGHPHVTDKIFEEGVKSPHESIRMTIADHPHAPDHVIQQLITDPNEKVRKFAKVEWDVRNMADGFK